MYVTNVTVLKGDRGLTEVTPYDILEAALGFHGLANAELLLEMQKSYIKCNPEDIAVIENYIYLNSNANKLHNIGYTHFYLVTERRGM